MRRCIRSCLHNPYVRRVPPFAAEAAASRLKTLYDSAEVADLVAGVKAGQRLALSRAITLVESTRPQHKEAVRILWGECWYCVVALGALGAWV